MTCVYKENEDKIKIGRGGTTTAENAGFTGFIGL